MGNGKSEALSHGCTIAGRDFAFKFQSSEFGSEVRDLLSYSFHDAPARPVLTCLYVTGEPASDLNNPISEYVGRIDEYDCGYRCLIAADERRFIVEDKAELSLRSGSGQATITMAEACEPRLAAYLAHVAMEIFLEATGCLVLHAAAVRDNQGRGAILFGPSGNGKTTATLALGFGGFGVHSDDLSIIFPDMQSPTAGGFPRPFKVHRKTANMLPALHDRINGDWDENDEQELPFENAFRTGSEASTCSPVSYLIVLNGPSFKPAHVMQQISRTECLSTVSADNLNLALLQHDQLERQRFRRLGAIVGRLPCYALSVGTQLDTLADFVTPHSD